MIKLIGDGGHAKVVREVIAAAFPAWKLKLNKWFGPDYVFVAVGNNYHRRKESRKSNGPFIKLIHPSAQVSPSAHIGTGTIVMAGAVIQANAVIGQHCIINSCASVDHDCVLDDFVHIAPGAHLCGTVHVAEGSMVGTGVCIAQNCTIPEWSLVKARRLEIEPLPDNR